MEPAKSVIEKLGGVEAVAKVTGKHVSRIYRWTYPVERGGTGGLIPQREIPRLIEHARRKGVALAHADFFSAPAHRREVA
ncbi:hypothetical protein [Hyphomicrobium sp.]|uniref:hypothetical protein n=1 Tax=Hyphomicrobium sp. TaxID=82 RepID=UPI0025BCF2C2|nr:hypothetical protein [Hyphomicrobium sp.]MCC7253839.1 hypothetical protein [Hyphomicrobium sp.]